MDDQCQEIESEPYPLQGLEPASEQCSRLEAMQLYVPLVNFRSVMKCELNKIQTPLEKPGAVFWVAGGNYRGNRYSQPRNKKAAFTVVICENGLK